MKVMLFDMWAGGHSGRYVDRFSSALAAHEVIAVAPQSVLADVSSSHASFVTVPHPRSAPTYGRPEESWDESIQNEVGLIGELVAEHRPDLLIHLFADHLV